MKRFLSIVLMACVVLGWTSCKKYSPTYRKGMPSEYALAYQQQFSRCYDSIPYDVVALDLYSEGLELDANRRIRGTGYNLYLSDIFVPDDTTRLVAGTYRSNDSGQPFSFLPGRDWDGTPTGIYLLYIEEDKLQSILVLDSGLMVVKDTTNGLIDLQFTLYYKNAYGYKATYKTHFQGVLRPWEK